MHKKTKLAGLLALLLAPGLAFAQAPAAAPEKEGPITFWGLELTGYLDVAYSHLSGRGAFNTTPAGPGVTVGGPNRVFDYNRNSFNLHQAAVTVSKQPKEGFGGLLNVTIGKDADVIASYKTDPSDGSGCNLATGLSATGSCERDKFDVTQAFLQYAIGPVTIMGGKFVTLSGAEVINSTANTNYSRSILFGYAIPFSHTGVRVAYAATDTLTLTGGVNNGWDTLKDTNSDKTLELGVTFAPMKQFTIGAQAYSGKERVGGLINTGPEGTRTLLDLVATFNATDKLTFIVNYDYATQDNTAAATPLGAAKAKWQGWAGYINYQINDQWRVSLRGEYFDDQDGYRTGVVQKWKEATLTVGYAPIKNLELRAEVRGDRSNVPAFIDSNNVTASKDQSSYALQAIYKF